MELMFRVELTVLIMVSSSRESMVASVRSDPLATRHASTPGFSPVTTYSTSLATLRQLLPLPVTKTMMSWTAMHARTHPIVAQATPRVLSSPRNSYDMYLSEANARADRAHKTGGLAGGDR